ncbi:MAG: 50S ribosome-binding GTPase [Bacillaceae bacterium]|nr:50S ribosome-binding GTPase [Bacillaceae bacterium]
MTSYRVALAGNPNTGKSTLFNTLTGLKQHTGNWPGKTVIRAEGTYVHNNQEYTLVDLPGTYSLYANSADEEVARDYIVFEKPDVTVVVMDATAMERNLNLALQVMEMTDRVILCINLMDEAEKKGMTIHDRKLADRLGVPVVKISARNKQGIDQLLDAIERMAEGKITTRPYRVTYSEDLEQKIREIEPDVRKIVGDQYPARWIALRLLDGDYSLLKTLQDQLLNQRGKGVETGELSVSCHT